MEQQIVQSAGVVAGGQREQVWESRAMDRRSMLRVAAAGGLACSVAALSVGCASTQGSASGSSVKAGAAARGLANEVAAGVRYFQNQCSAQLPLVAAMVKAIEARDLAGAKRAYIESRPPYEQIEVLANSFEDSDRDIDARPYAFADGEEDTEFRGFHKVEALVFGYEDLDAALPYAKRLYKSIEQLSVELAEPGRFNASLSFDGMIALATEIPAKKISSEEETWSDQSMLIFRNNWEGIWSQFGPMARKANAAKAGAGDAVHQAYKAAMALMEGHFSLGSAAGTPYSRIGIAKRRQIANASLKLRSSLLAAREALGV